MKSFTCTCGNRLHYENTSCLTCGSEVGYAPALDEFVSLTTNAVRPCANRKVTDCNWITSDGSDLCVSCQTTRTIPNLTDPLNVRHLTQIEAAKRRMFRSLITLRLWTHGYIAPRLQFDFLKPSPDRPPVVTGHNEGLITINTDEASNESRERTRDHLHEPYRTLLGHLRHEVGHFFWDVLVKGQPCIEEFRSWFGDERADYQASMQQHYESGPPAGWMGTHISAYATMHPWEDWAETWAHFMHRHDTLETIEDLALHSRVNEPSIDAATFVGIAGAGEAEAEAFTTSTSRWIAALLLGNELSRSMGQPDMYPFAPPHAALQKLFFIDRLVARAATTQQG